MSRGDLAVALGWQSAGVVDRTGDEARAVGPATPQPTGTTLTLPGPLVGGAFDDSATGYDCAVTVNTDPGATDDMDLGLRRGDGVGGERWSRGDCREYAGPGEVQAPGACVDVTAAVNDRSKLWTDVNREAGAGPGHRRRGGGVMTVHRPQDVPDRFADAWNRGDADGIAALFAADADFVNVVGLWWRDRESIRRAHAYGLRVIFPGAVMGVSRVRVRRLGPDVAVVHCRWTVSGQTLPDGGEGDTRRGVLSFVARWADPTWVVVSAHNTDIVPGAESPAARGDLRTGVDHRRTPPARP